MAEKTKFNRRDFLKVVGAGAGLAATGCGSDLPEKFIPYVIQPDEVIPGVSTWYAGSCNECSAGCGVLVRTREGRALKVEGNPKHPVNKGGLCTHGQSSVQALYDPDRVREPLKRDIGGGFKTVSWKDATDNLAEVLAGLKAANSQAVFITAPTSASELAIIEEFSKKVPLQHIEYDLNSTEALDKATEVVYGSSYKVSYDFSKAKLLVSFGADYLESWKSPCKYSREWAEGRKANSHGKGSRVIHFEPRLSLTAGNADKWIMNAPQSETVLLLALLEAIIKKSKADTYNLQPLLSKLEIAKLLPASGVELKTLDAVADELLAAKGNSLVVAGGASVSGEQALSTAVLSHLLNSVLDNVGSNKSVSLFKDKNPQKESSFKQLTDLFSAVSKKQKKVGALIFVGVNPIFTLPKNSMVTEALKQVPMVVAISTNNDETASTANLILPLSHQIETWSDSEPLPGVYNLNQPAMQPLYKTQSLGDTLIALATNAKLKSPFPEEITSYQEYLKSKWKERTGSDNFESRWLSYVQNGGDWSKQETATSSVNVSLAKNFETIVSQGVASKTEKKSLSLLAYPSVNSFDGKAANRPWMQELPSPITSAVWGSWAEMHPDVAAAYNLKKGDMVQLVVNGAAIEVPVYVTKFIHPELIAVPLGQGHQSYNRYANGVGANVLSLIAQKEAAAYQQLVAEEVILRNTIAKDTLVLLQGSDSQFNRGITRTTTVAALTKSATHSDKEKSEHHEDAHGKGHGAEHEDPLALGPREEEKMMYKQMEHPLYKWGMSIDLSACTGCSACVVACYAENNIPVVGKTICDEGREMSWLKIERFLDGPADQPVEAFAPVMCQHCGNAPCEPVCPVYATYHTDEGVNSMVYNRCVGTRYCANNCSYKVRRFNWYKYDYPEPLNWQLNPDVTVREVGVMEKCSFCVQRIKEGQNTAKDEGRMVRDGEVQPACASSCPTQAIKFGNLNDKESLVSKDHQDSRSYKILDAELNTQPAVAYLARVRNEL
ncbi:MAG: molybdopterin-dependent oxidoreductase [Proteobacteria bacterium]|nr:molybdopterin-dependent oxidoreductase [Pseudomonadota bacterium]